MNDVSTREFKPPLVSPQEASLRFKPGDRWAYRGLSDTRVTEAEILRVGTKRPARIKVRLLDDEFEGDEPWVSTAHLWVPWSDVEALRSELGRWHRVRSEVPSYAEVTTSWFLTEGVLGSAFSYHDYRTGVGIIHDADQVAAVTGLPTTDLDDPNGFDEPDGRVVGWRVVEKITRALLLSDNGRRVKGELAQASQFRALHLAHTRATLGLEAGEPLPDDLRGLRPNDYDADNIDEGLRSVLGDAYFGFQRNEDARLVLNEATAVLREALTEFEKGPKALRRSSLADRIRAVLARVQRLDDGLRAGSDLEVTAESAESPQERP